MKYILIVLFLLISIILLVPKVSTKSTFNLTKKEFLDIQKQVDNGKFEAIKKMYLYYHYSINDYNKSIEVLRQGAKLGDAFSQYKLSLYFMRDYYPYGKRESFKGEGVYWLKQSAKLGYPSAIEELKKHSSLLRSPL